MLIGVVGAAGFEPATPWSQRMSETFRLVPLHTKKPRISGRLEPGGALLIPFGGSAFRCVVCQIVCQNYFKLSKQSSQRHPVTRSKAALQSTSKVLGCLYFRAGNL